MTDIAPDRQINIKGMVCPYTFVKAKLALEAMEVGQVLEILLDHEEATRSIPRSMQSLGQKVLDVRKVNDSDWILLVRKERD